MIIGGRVERVFFSLVSLVLDQRGQINQKRRGDLAPRREKAKLRLLIFRGQARE
jgi:hypothetical protein